MAKSSTTTSSTRRAAAGGTPRKARKRRQSAAARTAATAATREAREEQRHAPVSLPSGGCFEQSDLAKALDSATDNDVANRGQEISKALGETNSAASTLTAAPNSLPDHSIARAEVALTAGTENADGKLVGGTSVTEFRQVYTGDGGAAAANDDNVVDPAVIGAAVDGHSEVMSLEIVAAAPLAAPVSTSVPATSAATGAPGTTSAADAVEATIAGALAEGAASLDGSAAGATGTTTDTAGAGQ